MDDSTHSVKSIYSTLSERAQDLEDHSAFAMWERAQVDPEQKRLLKIRKKCELKLVKKYDTLKIDSRKEFWFLIDSKWLNQWSLFVNKPDEEPPRVISSEDLLDANGDPLPGLKPKIDYRGVSPMVYYILGRLYGRDDSPDLCRYVIDIYDHPVPPDRLIKITYRAVLDAKIEVNKVRHKWVKWDRDDGNEIEDDGLNCCCGLTKQHLEAFIYWMILCWSGRRTAGRSDISYRDYRPLMKQGSEHGDGSSHGGRSPLHGSNTNNGSTTEKDEEDDEDDDDDDDDDSSDEGGLQMAPADMHVESGNWLQLYSRGGSFASSKDSGSQEQHKESYQDDNKNSIFTSGANAERK